MKREDGKLVGCGFIQFEKVNQAAKAIHHGNGKELGGRQIILDWAVNRKKFVSHTKQLKKTAQVKEIKEESDDEKLSIKMEDESASDEEERENQDDDEGEEAEDSEDAEDDNSSVDEKKPIHKQSNDVAEGCTVFIKNIPFESTENDLRQVCKPFGALYYAVITKDKISGHSKGTGFVKFKVGLLFIFLFRPTFQCNIFSADNRFGKYVLKCRHII